MNWIEPKTNWQVTIIDGNYLGDFFNTEDYNRIRNNLEYLKDLANKMYDEFELVFIPPYKTPTDFFYAEEMNAIEENLDTINENTINTYYGAKQTYRDNEPIMDANELNRIEEAMLDLYQKLTNQYEGGRKLTLNFGMKEGF